MNIDKLREQLKIDEGVKYEVYKDHLGYPTFGIGHLVVEGDEEHGQPVGTPVSEERVNSVFESDVELYVSEAKKVFPNLLGVILFHGFMRHLKLLTNGDSGQRLDDHITLFCGMRQHVISPSRSSRFEVHKLFATCVAPSCSIFSKVFKIWCDFRC